jgi:5-methylcytosine-specific restriction endonuclease McrA
MRTYRKAHPEKVVMGNQVFKQNNPDYHHEWAKSNPEKVKQYAKKWYSNNVHKVLAKNRRRRVRELENGFEIYTDSQVLELYGTDCYLCGEPIDLSAPRWTKHKGWELGLHIDHVHDIALGGEDKLENVRPAHGLCNIKKKPQGKKEE